MCGNDTFKSIFLFVVYSQCHPYYSESVSSDFLLIRETSILKCLDKVSTRFQEEEAPMADTHADHHSTSSSPSINTKIGYDYRHDSHGQSTARPATDGSNHKGVYDTGDVDTSQVQLYALPCQLVSQHHSLLSRRSSPLKLQTSTTFD